MKILIYVAHEIGSIIATEFFEDHDIIVIFIKLFINQTPVFYNFVKA